MSPETSFVTNWWYADILILFVAGSIWELESLSLNRRGLLLCTGTDTDADIDPDAGERRGRVALGGIWNCTSSTQSLRQ